MVIQAVLLLSSLVLTAAAGSQAQKRATPPFQTALAIEEMEGKQAVVETTEGAFVIDLLPGAAPNHVGYFIKLASEGAYDGTTFHRVIRHGIIQGGDPLSRDPAKAKLYGTGGLGVLRAEISGERHTRGTVSAVIQPDKPDSAGAQFFICVTDQPALDGKYTVFGRVSEGLDVVQRISETPATGQVPQSRIVMTRVTIRDAPPPEPEAFSTESPEALAQYGAIVETSLGPIALELFSDRAPEHVRNFLRLADAGVYDGTAFHRVVPGFVIQGGYLTTRGPLTERQQKLVRTLPPEFNDTPHVKGILSMARGDDPASATTSFFIVTGNASSLDGKYTVFGRVTDGLDVVEAIERTPVDGETPVNRIEVKGVRVIRKG